MTIKIQAAQGVPLAQIARSLGIDRKTARRLRDAQSEPTSPASRSRPSALAKHEQYVRDRLAAGVPAAQIARDLSRDGVAIPYSTVRDFARPLRPAKPPASEEIRFETVPAKQAQCDWSDFGKVLEDGLSRPLCLFVMVLGYSRFIYATFTTSMNELVLQRCHQEAFAAFGGVPHEVLFDNMKTVTVGRDGAFQPIFQREFADFAARYGFTPKCAQPYRAKTKGKVERAIGFVETSFLPGRTFTDLVDANAQLADWLIQANGRVHRTHGEVVSERFAREAPLLIALRPGMQLVAKTAVRVVDAEGCVNYATNRYELPRGYRGRTVVVRDDGTLLRVYDGSALICEHPVMQGRDGRARRLSTAPTALVSLQEYRAVTVERRSLALYDEIASQ